MPTYRLSTPANLHSDKTFDAYGFTNRDDALADFARQLKMNLTFDGDKLGAADYVMDCPNTEAGKFPHTQKWNVFILSKDKP
jgi:hypothetical protein